MALLLIACARASLTTSATTPTASQRAAPPLTQATAEYDAVHYKEAEAIAQAWLADPEEGAAARLTLARVQLATGDYAGAAASARRAWESKKELEQPAKIVAASALSLLGQLTQAEEILGSAARKTGAWEAKRLLAELELQQGHRAKAEPLLQELIEAYNDDRISEHDPIGLTQVGRAADLLRSPQDANEAYNQAEQASEQSSDQLLLWRAQLTLQRHDPDQAAQLLSELLRRAANHPLALALMAQVKLAQGMDFDAAEDLAKRALRINPNLSEARFVLAGVRLRDMDLAGTEEWTKQGLRTNPNDLKLLSLRATAQFLIGDQSGFVQTEQTVLRLNPQFSELYVTVAEYADWEHRYPEVVTLLRRATQIDGDDAQASAGLGLNLIRLGEESEGRSALQHSFAQDPFNVQVYNTLNLFEQVIDKQYTSLQTPPFRLRVAKQEAAILQRYVPTLLNQAWQRLIEFYEFTPENPIGIELYGDHEQFAVRTSGLPNIGIQGVCFGKTLAAVTPADQPLNLGMTLWHELSHVFHIQLSKGRVPRWFTEGLAEYETQVERPEWKRELDLELYRALVMGRMPAALQMNRAFTHAESMEAMAVAYYGSTQLVAFIVQHYGRASVRQMLLLWGQGKPTEEVLTQALGVSGATLDQAFHVFLVQNLSRYEKQFVSIPGSTDPAQVEYAKAREAFASGQPKQCIPIIQDLLTQGHDGFEVQLLLGKCQHRAGEDFDAALTRAHQADETQAEPLEGLWVLARERRDEAAEIAILRKLARLEEHSAEVYRRLLQLLVSTHQIDEALTVGQSAAFVDIEGAQTHALYAQALDLAHRFAQADAEFDSALLCPGEDAERTKIREQFVLSLQRRGLSKQAATRRAQSAANGE
ncbi:MAG TPA: hypothetical protein VL137_06340 [Polyangiaceae bacterium]|nr:hypothetical protein [Polyangiaceae bacterium]